VGAGDVELIEEPEEVCAEIGDLVGAGRDG
jgi:hypothetical protein